MAPSIDGVTYRNTASTTGSRLVRVGTRVFAPGETLQAGEYAIPANASVRDIVRLMAEGNAVQHAITFPEGITVSAAMKLIAESEYLTGDLPEAVSVPWRWNELLLTDLDWAYNSAPQPALLSTML